MKKLLDVRQVGFLRNIKGDTRSPESFAFPACLTSLMEYLGEDVGWESIQAHNREWTHRFANKAYLAASGMAFGLLWHPDICPSSFDLMQVNKSHNDTVRYAFDYAGYHYEIVDRQNTDRDAMRTKVVASIDAGRPVLAFGIVGPPECGIICGYGQNGATVYGWSHFQSYDPTDCAVNGMFRISGWEKEVWEIVLCGEKKARDTDLRRIIARGISIMETTEIDGYLAGSAAYDAWIDYVSDSACEDMDGQTLRKRHGFHSMLVGNHAEARCYLGNFLNAQANGHESLVKAADCFNQIHDTCWKAWGVLGGLGAKDGFLGLRKSASRRELAQVIRDMKALDATALVALKRYLM